jgi:hypothetical protein
MSSSEAGSTTQSSWRTASRCTGGECVQVAQRDDAIILRDSTQPNGVVLDWTPGEWRSFISDIKAGHFGAARS